MTRADVLREYGAHAQLDSDPSSAEEGMADEIVRLRSALAAAPKVTVLDRWAVVDNTGAVWATRYATKKAAETDSKDIDELYPSYAPHTVRRVAQLDDPTTRGES